ncbi:hypothetical protein L0244_13900 [bacterium]|nr:hypothetical protein [bacterium]MCI0614074.1 hypothetical protein [bacterium]
MKRVLEIASVFEFLTGIALLWSPSVVVQLLFGSEISGIGVILSRIAGIALIALGVSCWPGKDKAWRVNQAYGGMLTYSLLAALYLAYIGLKGQPIGKLLWLAVIVHVIMTLLLAIGWFRMKSEVRLVR